MPVMRLFRVCAANVAGFVYYAGEYQAKDERQAIEKARAQYKQTQTAKTAGDYSQLRFFVVLPLVDALLESSGG